MQQEVFQESKELINSNNSTLTFIPTAPNPPTSMNKLQQEKPTKSRKLKNIRRYPNGRTRASKACYECNKRHTRCGFVRPCPRCKRYGLQCIDIPSTKRRGRSQKTNIPTTTMEKSDEFHPQPEFKPMDSSLDQFQFFNYEPPKPLFLKNVDLSKLISPTQNFSPNPFTTGNHLSNRMTPQDLPLQLPHIMPNPIPQNTLVTSPAAGASPSGATHEIQAYWNLNTPSK